MGAVSSLFSTAMEWRPNSIPSYTLINLYWATMVPKHTFRLTGTICSLVWQMQHGLVEHSHTLAARKDQTEPDPGTGPWGWWDRDVGHGQGGWTR